MGGAEIKFVGQAFLKNHFTSLLYKAPTPVKSKSEW
jgi:hypothetical protein